MEDQSIFIKTWFHWFKKNIYVVVFLLIFLSICIFSIQKKSPTYDEPHHLEYGKKILHGDSNRIKDDDSKMAFSILNAIPDRLGDFISAKRVKIKLKKMESGRYITIFFALIFAVFVGKWGKEMYGIQAGLFSLFLFSFSPNIIAHSRLITTDIYGAGMGTIFLFFFWRFLKFKKKKDGAFAAISFGLAQVAKYSCTFLVIISGIILIIKFIVFIWESKGSIKIKKMLPIFSELFIWIAIFLVTTLLIINSSYLFNKTMIPLKSFHFQSSFFKTIQSKFHFLGFVPIPLPEPYVQGLDRVKFRDQTGYGNHGVYLWGDLRRPRDQNFRGFKTYFFQAFLFKVPITIQVFFMFSLFVFFKDILKNWKKTKKGNALSDFFSDEIFLLVAILFYCIYYNFFFRLQIGFRFFLATLPLVFLFCSRIFKNESFFSFPRWKKWGVGVCSLYYVISVLSYYPHYISYFNEFIGDRKLAYRVLGDSNIDWGQNFWYWWEYKNKNPDIINNPEFPRPGRLLVHTNALIGIAWASPKKYQWLRENFRPVEHVGYTHLIYDISEKEFLEKVLPEYR